MKRRFDWLLIDIFLFSFLAVIFGILVDAIFPEPGENETFTETCILLILQILLDGILVYILGFGYESVVQRDPDLYYGFTIFTVIFFLVQLQLLSRLRILYSVLAPNIQL